VYNRSPMNNKDYTVYMLHCCDNSYYIGVTSDLKKKL